MKETNDWRIIKCNFNYTEISNNILYYINDYVY